MQVLGYIFLARDRSQLVAEAEQAAALATYCRDLGLSAPRCLVEEHGHVKRPLRLRQRGKDLLAQLTPGDVVVVLRAAWVLSSAFEGERLLQQFKAGGIALHCVDLGGNISLPEKRRLQVSEGPASLVAKLLAALTVCERGGQGRAIRTAKRHGRDLGKYLGGPVPFGWEVDGGGFLTPHEGQQRIIEAMHTLRRERWSYREISRKLLEEYGVRLSHEGVRRLCSGGRGGGSATRGQEASSAAGEEVARERHPR